MKHHRALTLTFLLLLIVTLLGCPPSGGDGGDDDDNDDDTNSSPTSYITSSDPMDGDKNVSPIKDIIITFSEALDESTINKDNIDLTADCQYGRFPLTYTLDYDNSSNTLTIRRSLRLISDEDTTSSTNSLPPPFSYRVIISNLITELGEMIETTSIAFSGFKYTTKIDYDQFDNVTGYLAFRFDSEGNREREISYISAGLDGIWFTADDTAEDHRYMTNDSNGHTVREIEYNDPGPDTVWLTFDDDIYGYYDSTYGNSGRAVQILIYREMGSDGIWFSPDDIEGIIYHISLSYNSDNRLDQDIVYLFGGTNSEGPDSIPLTADDIPEYYREYRYSPEGPLTKEIRFSDPGDDEIWFTADDVIGQNRNFMRDPSNYKIQEITYTGPGPDGSWETDDDKIKEYINYTRDANGNVSREVEYDDEGLDGIWFTADDEFDEYTDYEYDDRGLLIKATLYTSPGIDGVWFNEDDLYVSYSTYEVDED